MLQAKILDLNSIVSDMDQMLRRLIGEDIDYLIVLKPSIGQVKADPGQIEQVLMNLIVNARDAMPREIGVNDFVIEFMILASSL